MSEIKKENARFDTRLPKEQKQLFEQAAQLGGYRNLTDFMLAALQKRAREIIEEHEKVIASQRDRKIFFDAVMNPSPPNPELRSAVEDYKKMQGNVFYY